MQRHLVGTLFEEEEITKKQTHDNMKAKDPMGNTRWKGAFTGGFEAGFKNTCGSKEGWTPAHFVSSVARRAQKVQQNVSDFMDKEDLGRETIESNILVNSQFQGKKETGINFTVKETMGEQILRKMRQKQASITAPENQENLQKLFDIYAHQEEKEQCKQGVQLLGIDHPYSVGTDSRERLAEDDFVATYAELYRKVIQGSLKAESQQELKKRREQNKIYFDFSKPQEQEPEYLKEIQQIDALSQPRKRKNNVLNYQSLQDLFIASETANTTNSNNLPSVPQEYDPYHRIRQLNNSQQRIILQKKLQKAEENKHRAQTIYQRSQLLGQNRLSQKFRSGSNTFMKSSKDKITGLKKYFQDEKKNERYLNYVMELEGKKINAQTEGSDWDTMHIEKAEFEKVYKIEKQGKVPEKLEQQLSRPFKSMKITRTVISWKPEKALCRQFKVLLPQQK